MAWLDDLFGLNREKTLKIQLDHSLAVNVTHNIRFTSANPDRDEILEALGLVRSSIMSMQDAIAEVRAAVEVNTSVDQSAVALIKDLADRFEAVAGNEADVRALAAALRDSNVTLAEAVTANTPTTTPPADPPADPTI